MGLIEWVFETYKDTSGLGDISGSRKFRSWIHDGPRLNRLKLSPARRIQNFLEVKYNYPLRHGGYTVELIRLVTGGTGLPVAYAYWVQGATLPEYVCVSPTYDSKDGEYRHQWLRWKQFTEAYDALASELAGIERVVSETLQTGKAAVVSDWYPKGAEYEHKARSEGERVAVRTLVATLATYRQRIAGGTFPPHVSDSFRAVYDRFPLTSVLEALSNEALERFHWLAVGKNPVSGVSDLLECGQKLVPLSRKGAAEPTDLAFAPWREIYANELCNDLLVNFVGPMFPVFGNWTHVVGADEGLFENQAMRDLYRRSQESIQTLKSLREARKAVPRKGDDYREAQLELHIYESIEYAQSYIMMSDIALVLFGEMVGITMATIAEIYTAVPGRIYLVASGGHPVFGELDVFAKLFFDILLGAHIIHSRVGLIHGDLHLNNMTVRTAFSYKYTRDPPRPTVAYSVNATEDSTYVFPNYGLDGVLIDFSRAIFSPAHREQLVKEKGQQYVTNFFRDQVGRSLRTIYQYVPRFAEKNQEALKGLLLADPESMFRVMSAVDFLAAGKNIRGMLQSLADSSDPDTLPVAPGAIAMAAAVEERARDYLIDGLSALIGALGTVDGSAARPHARSAVSKFPGDVILPEVFHAYKYRAQSEKALEESVLVSAYNCQNELKYSGTDPERFPPWAQLDEIRAHLGGVSFTDLFEFGVSGFFDAEAAEAADIARLGERSRADLDDRPEAVASSWLPVSSNRLVTRGRKLPDTFGLRSTLRASHAAARSHCGPSSDSD